MEAMPESDREQLLAKYRQTALSDKDLWMGVFGSSPDEWGWSDIVFLVGDWEHVGSADVSFYDTEVEGGPENHRRLGQALVNVRDLREALEQAVMQNLRDTCTGYPITLDYDNWDACTSDLILQIAVLGREVLA